MEKSFTGGRPQTCQNPSLPSSRPGSRGLYLRCEGIGCGLERPSSANASTEDFARSLPTKISLRVQGLAGSSCVNLRTAGDGGRPGTAGTAERRPGTAGSISQSVRSMYSCKSMASSMSRRHSRKQSCVALSFDQLFTQSYSRASKRMACERKEGIRPGTALRDRKQYRSLHRWWTMAELKVAEEAGDLEDHGSDGNSTASGFGDDHSGKEVQKVATAPATPMLGARRRSIEALLEKRRTSLKAAKMMKEMANAAPQGPEEEEKEEQPKHRKFKKARGMTIDVTEVKDPDLIEILQLPQEHEVRMFLGESSGADEFTEKEIERLRKAFVKHRSTFSSLALCSAVEMILISAPLLPSLEIHSDDIPQILDYLGHLKISEEKIQEFLSEITKYSTLEFDEFVSFMLLARAYDHEEVSKIFTKFDADGSGELSVEELEDVLKSLGITPFRSTISGALAVVDSDDSGTLDYQEFAEIMKLYRIFRRFAEALKDGSGRSVLPSALSSKALMEMFGSQTALLASRLGSDLPRPPSQQSDADEEGKRKKNVDGEGMTLREFLLWARRLREVEVEWYRQEFERADVDKGGYLDQDEIRLVLQRVGYTPLRAVILDLIDAVGPLKGDVMDFDEFVEMMEIFRTNNGFTRNEVKDFRHSFDMFNTSQQEEVDVIQVGSILRSLGIGAELAEVQALVKTVDWNGSNSLDFNEFLRLMRLQREDELMSVKQVFDSKADASVTADGNVRVTIDPKDVSSMFRGLGYPDSVGKSTMDLFLGLVREPLDYDALVLLVDSCRRMNMQKMRKQASFTDENDGSGVIAQKELVSFCKERGLPLATKQDQQNLLGFINEARRAALNAGVAPEQCGGDESPTLTFWASPVPRPLQDQLKASELRSSGGNSFSQAEVDELSHFFVEGVEEEKKAQKGKDGDPNKATLSINGLWSVLKKIGVTLTPIEKEEVKVKLFMDCGNTLNLSAFMRTLSCGRDLQISRMSADFCTILPGAWSSLRVSLC
eukprot:s2726_g11.t1